jgi:hypothetical protein
MLTSIMLAVANMLISIKITELLYPGNPVDVWPFVSVVLSLCVLKLVTYLSRK